MSIYGRIVFYMFFISIVSLFASLTTINMPPYNFYLLCAALMSGVVGCCFMMLYFINRLDETIKEVERSIETIDRRISWVSDHIDRTISDSNMSNLREIEAVRREFNEDIRELSISIEKTKDKVSA